MSLAIPTTQEYRATLDRLAGEHARRVMAEREAARLRDVIAKRSDAKPRDWSDAMYDAAQILQGLPVESEVVTGQRRNVLRGVA